MSGVRQEQERLFTSQVVRLSRVYRKEANRGLGGCGISDAQALPVLHIARCGGGVRQNVLAEEIGIEGPSLVRLLDQLCAHGLVERRDDTCDRRAKTLHLTSAGNALAARIEAALSQVRSGLLASVSDADLEAALRVLGALEEGLAARADASKADR